MNENGDDVFDKRLLSMVPGAVKFIVADVALQWVALACNIALFVVIGLFLQATLEGAADAGMAIGVFTVSAAAIVVRMICQTAAQRMAVRPLLARNVPSASRSTTSSQRSGPLTARLWRRPSPCR